MSLTMTDMFCGAGGSSTGAIQVPGVSVRVASNRREQVRLAGNAVTPPSSRDLIAVGVEALGGAA